MVSTVDTWYSKNTICILVLFHKFVFRGTSFVIVIADDVILQTINLLNNTKRYVVFLQFYINLQT